MNRSKFNFFQAKPIQLLEEYERWRRVAKELKLSREARLRLEWIIDYYQGNTSIQTARHYGISKKTFYKWFGQFDRDNLYSLFNLEDKSRAPKHVRQKEVTPLEEQRIIQLRKARVRYGKMKIAKIYKDTYHEEISSWKVQGVIETYQLYYNLVKTAKIASKRQRGQKKKRITELKLDTLKWYEKKSGYIVCLDTIVIHWHNVKRYIFTAVDKYGKVAYARMYKNKSSKNGADFLLRLYYLLDGKIPRVGHDNGTEFEKYFKAACQKLQIEQYYSRARTPKHNPNNERFNRTLREEFIALGNYHCDPEIFNRKLTEWLIEYNFRRPHTALNYQTPLEFSKKLPMYSSCTRD